MHGVLLTLFSYAYDISSSFLRKFYALGWKKVAQNGLGQNIDTFRKGIEHQDPEISANVVICLIKLTTFLLRKQIQRLEQDFLKNGGLRERMTQARLASRKPTKPTN